MLAGESDTFILNPLPDMTSTAYLNSRSPDKLPANPRGLMVAGMEEMGKLGILN